MYAIRSYYVQDAEHRKVSFNRLVAKLPTIVAMAYKYNTGQPFMFPRIV